MPCTCIQEALEASIGSLEYVPLSAVCHLVRSLLQQRDGATTIQTSTSAAPEGDMRVDSGKAGGAA